MLQILPVERREFSIKFKGMIISMSKDKTLDRQVQEIIRRSYTIKYHRGTASFYIPPVLSRSLYISICGGTDWKEAVVESLPIEDAMVYMED